MNINLNMAVSEKVENRDLFFFNNKGLSTLDEKIAERHIQGDESYRGENVKVDTLSNICRSVQIEDISIGFLKIDVEEFERQVLLGIDFEKLRPKLLIVESTLPMSSEESWKRWELLLVKESGYIFCCFDALNRFYVFEEYQKSQHYFSLPVNLWDGFESVVIHERRLQIQDLQAEINWLHK